MAVSVRHGSLEAMASKLSCVVIGGGVTGLALAHRLLVLGGGRIGVTVLEAQSRTGGWVESNFQDGMLMEGGARSLRVPGNGATTLKLINELKLSDQILPAASAAKVRYIWYKGKRQMIPNSLLSMVGNPLTMPLVSGVALEPFQHRRFIEDEEELEDESMHSFFSRRLGRFVADKVLTAVVSGVWAGDARKLSIRSCMPSLVASERAHGSLILGGLLGGKPPPVDPEVAHAMKLAGGPHGVFSFRNGLQSLTDRLTSEVKRLGGDIRMSSKVSAIMSESPCWLKTGKPKAEVWVGRGGDDVIHADHVFSTVSAPVTGAMIKDADPAAAAQLSQIKNTSVAVISLAFASARDSLAGRGAAGRHEGGDGDRSPPPPPEGASPDVRAEREDARGEGRGGGGWAQGKGGFGHLIPAGEGGESAALGVI